MANEIRGERTIVMAGRSLDIALTMGALAELEARFGVDFDQVGQYLFRRETSAEGLAYPLPKARALVTFWRAVLGANGHDPALVDAAGVSPYALLRDALALIRFTQDDWFQSEREPAANRPLAAGRGGATGSAPASAGSN
jgi:hypothetical protein